MWTLLLLVTTTSAETTEQKSMAVVDKLRSGSRVSDIVEGVETFMDSFQRAPELVRLIESLHIPSVSCYNNILANLRVDCRVASETEQRSFTLNFTKCFYNISGISLTLDPKDSEELQIEKMSRSAYQTYILFKQHWRNLCHFAQQLVLSEETAWSLADLLHTMVASTLAGLELREELNRTTAILNETLVRIGHQVDEANRNLAVFFDGVGGLGPLFHWMGEFIGVGQFFINNLKLFLAGVLALAILGIVVPKMIRPLAFISIVIFVGKKSLCHLS
jgi:hypothetical protein